MNKNENLDVKLALEEMRLTFKMIYDNGDVIDQKINMILIAAGLILGLTTSVNISFGITNSLLYWIIFAVAFSLYLFTIVGVLIGAKPTTYHLPIAAKWEVLDQNIFDRSERDAILSILSGYVDQIQYNKAINKRKANIFLLSMISLILSVVLILMLVLI